MNNQGTGVAPASRPAVAWTSRSTISSYAFTHISVDVMQPSLKEQR